MLGHMDPKREAIDTCAKVTATTLLRLAQNDVRGALHLLEAYAGNGIRTSSEASREAHLFREMVAEELAAWDFINRECARLKREEPVDGPV